MRKKYIIITIIILIILGFTTGCKNKKKKNDDKNIVTMTCYKEIEEDDIVIGTIFKFEFIKKEISKLTLINKTIFNSKSVKYLQSEIDYLKEYYKNKNKIKGINASFSNDERSYEAEMTINYDEIKKKDLDSLDFDYKFSKNSMETDIKLTLETDNYICE